MNDQAKETQEQLEEGPRAWVGCLACYNAGRLVGAWMDGTEAADRDTFEAAVVDLGEGQPSATHSLAHEELWVMDYEGYGGLLHGECSPVEAARIATAIEAIEAAGHPVEAVAAYRDHVGASYFDLDDLSDFEEAYQSEWRTEEEFAENLAEEIGAVPEDASWPNNYIDWERATRDLFMGDYFSCEAPGGMVYVFRSL